MVKNGYYTIVPHHHKELGKGYIIKFLKTPILNKGGRYEN